MAKTVRRHHRQETEYCYYGGIFGYTHCRVCGRWWQVDFWYPASSENGKEVRQPYTRDLLTDFVEGR